MFKDELEKQFLCYFSKNRTVDNIKSCLFVSLIQKKYKKHCFAIPSKKKIKLFFILRTVEEYIKTAYKYQN